MSDVNPANDSDQNEAIAIYILSGSFDPDEITARVGIQPTETWRRGQPRTRGRRPYEDDNWHVTVRRYGGYDWGPCLGDLLTLLEPARDTLIAYGQQHSARIYGVFYEMQEVHPAALLERDVLRTLVALNVELDFEVYSIFERDGE